MFASLQTACDIYTALERHSKKIEIVDEGGAVIKSHQKKSLRQYNRENIIPKFYLKRKTFGKKQALPA